jgi:hypothetical protein
MRFSRMNLKLKSNLAGVPVGGLRNTAFLRSQRLKMAPLSYLN